MYGAVFRGYGFYSGAKKLADILKKDGYEVQIFPGISSVIYLAAKLGKSWEDAKILSMHGRSQNFIHVVANHEKTFLILGKSAGKEICENEILPSGTSNRFGWKSFVLSG